jgi:hypothetical protein
MCNTIDLNSFYKDFIYFLKVSLNNVCSASFKCKDTNSFVCVSIYLQKHMGKGLCLACEPNFTPCKIIAIPHKVQEAIVNLVGSPGIDLI